MRIALLCLLIAACKSVAPARDPKTLLPAVVLLVSERHDGTVRYGSGVILDDKGTVLTNAHVANDTKRLRAMLFNEGRTSYSPLDGGLSRFLFENDRALVDTRVVRSDRAADLAIVFVPGARAAIEWRDEPAQIGERVYALGHPQEAVWSLTAGIVAGQRDGLIQHDAQLSGGSSGGPLVDARGRVLGINTSGVVSEPGGAGFARDAAIVKRFLSETSSPHVVDRRTLESAALGCMRAQELGSAAAVECLDWDARYTIYSSVIADARRTMPEKGPLLDRLAAREPWIADQKRKVAAFFEGKTTVPAGDIGALQRSTGLKIDPFDASQLTATLKKGLRIEAVHRFKGDRAWVSFVGRNPDDSPYRFSECWQQRGDAWFQHSPPLADDLQALPKEYGAPLESLELTRQKYRAALQEKLSNG